MDKIVLKNNKEVIVRDLLPGDNENLLFYFNSLSPETKSRFGPHLFDKLTIDWLCSPQSNDHVKLIACDVSSLKIIAYSIVRLYIVEHEMPRLQTYGINPNHQTDCTFAPSIADAYQAIGLGKIMFGKIEEKLKNLGKKRIVLWGGVQSDNDLAVNYYIKLGFTILGEFWYNGKNFDMIKIIE